MGKNNFASIESIINVAKKGGMFILVDDEKRENEGDLVMSTSDTSAKNINFMAKYGRGLICLALDSIQAKIKFIFNVTCKSIKKSNSIYNFNRS